MYKVLVTGADGQLGSEIRQLRAEFVYTDRKELDITDFKAVEDYVSSNGINAIINCAAYTAVDKAETDKEAAYNINCIGVKNLAAVAKKYNAKMIHISTDYVFDGKNHKPYIESDATNPQSVYGQTKLDGEKALLEINPNNSIIIRTSWVYSSFGANFVKSILRLARERDELGIVFDQIGSPTYAKDLAKAIIEILEKLQNDKTQIYNYSSEGVVSWYDFAKEIVRMSGIECHLKPIESIEYPTPASRPHFSVLNKAKIKKEFGIEVPYWKDGLDECLIIMGERK